MELRQSIHLRVVAIEKGGFVSPATTNANFTFIYIYIYIYALLQLIIITHTHTHTHTHTYIYIYIYIYMYIYIYICIDGNYTRMLRAISNQSWRQHSIKQQLYGHQPSITKSIKIGWTRHAGHWWRSRDELVSDVPLWAPSHGRAKAGRPARIYILQLCADTGCNPEDLPEAMDERERWWERARDIHTDSGHYIYIYIILKSTNKSPILTVLCKEKPSIAQKIWSIPKMADNFNKSIGMGHKLTLNHMRGARQAGNWNLQTR